ncbi:MAG: serine protease [Candidatus Nealsonbacteria bacterium]|nr:serine protease [Candidatus Nealsonbacteria bacterium]
MSLNVLKIVFIFILGIGGGIFADQILWPYLVERPLLYQYRLEQSPVYVTERREVVIKENSAVTSAIEKVEKAVVGVRTRTGDTFLEGSGLIVASDGLMVTLASLVPQGSPFSFFVDGQTVSFQILKRDLKNNLALVKIGKTNLPTVGFADSAKLKAGERVFLIGAVFEGKEVGKAVNVGIIRSLNEDSFETNIFETSNLAGSPLFDVEGNTIGLSIIGIDGQVSAIPVTQIKQFLGF